MTSLGRASSRRPSRALLAVLVAFASLCVSLGTSLTVGAGSAEAATVGWTRVSSSVLGPTPLGLKVLVDSRPAHHSALYSISRTVAGQLHYLGLPVTFGGYGSTAQAPGRITVTEDSTGCLNGAGAVTHYWFSKLTDGHTVIDHAAIAVCPRTFSSPSWQWTTVLRHEFGHAVGLNHYNSTYGGRWQIMLGTSAQARDYQSGDVAGLRWLAHNGPTIRSLYPMKVSSSQRFTAGTIAVAGTATNPIAPGASVTVALTDNGVKVTGAISINLLTHTFVLVYPWKGGSHTLCVQARSTTSASTSSTSAGCATWS
jgi:hypothetical protein